VTGRGGGEPKRGTWGETRQIGSLEKTQGLLLISLRGGGVKKRKRKIERRALENKTTLRELEADQRL